MDERSRTAPAEMQKSTQSAMIYDPVPRFPDQIRLDTPTPTQECPAVLSYIIRTRRTARGPIRCISISDATARYR